MTSTASMPERAEQFRQAYRRLKDEIGKVIVGHSEIVDGVLTCLFVGGHARIARRRAWPRQDAASSARSARCSI